MWLLQMLYPVAVVGDPAMLKLKLSLFVDFEAQRYSLDKIHEQFNRNYNQINIKNI